MLRNCVERLYIKNLFFGKAKLMRSRRTTKQAKFEPLAQKKPTTFLTFSNNNNRAWLFDDSELIGETFLLKFDEIEKNFGGIYCDPESNVPFVVVENLSEIPKHTVYDRNMLFPEQHIDSELFEWSAEKFSIKFENPCIFDACEYTMHILTYFGKKNTNKFFVDEKKGERVYAFLFFKQHECPPNFHLLAAHNLENKPIDDFQIHTQASNSFDEHDGYAASSSVPSIPCHLLVSWPRALREKKIFFELENSKNLIKQIQSLFFLLPYQY